MDTRAFLDEKLLLMPSCSLFPSMLPVTPEMIAELFLLRFPV